MRAGWFNSLLWDQLNGKEKDMWTLCELARHLSYEDRCALAQLIARAIHEASPREPVVMQVREVNIEELSGILDNVAPYRFPELWELAG